MTKRKASAASQLPGTTDTMQGQGASRVDTADNAVSDNDAGSSDRDERQFKRSKQHEEHSKDIERLLTNIVSWTGSSWDKADVLEAVALPGPERRRVLRDKLMTKAFHAKHDLENLLAQLPNPLGEDTPADRSSTEGILHSKLEEMEGEILEILFGERAPEVSAECLPIFLRHRGLRVSMRRLRIRVNLDMASDDFGDAEAIESLEDLSTCPRLGWIVLDFETEDLGVKGMRLMRTWVARLREPIKKLAGGCEIGLVARERIERDDMGPTTSYHTLYEAGNAERVMMLFNGIKWPTVDEPARS